MSTRLNSGGDSDVALQTHRQLGFLEQRVEPLLFNHRPIVIALFAIVSIFLTIHACRLNLDASFQKMVPLSHPYIANYLTYESELRPLGNVVRIAVEARQGDIYTKSYLEVLKQITDDVFFIPGVDRGNMKSLWTPNVVWNEVTEDGFAGGQVMPNGFDGSPDMLQQVRINVLRSGRVGSLVANDHHSAVILVPLLEFDPKTGQKLNYGEFSERLETLIRHKYQNQNIAIHINGFAKIAGDLIEGAKNIALFFAITFGLTALLLLAYTRCWRSTLVTLFCCSLAVVWQLGIVQILGFTLDPYSILVPFLVFAIGVSHAVQNINTVATDCAMGYSKLDAAKRTFRLLFIPGSIALLCDVVGFSTMLVINIGVIRELAIAASIGVAVIIFTKMFLLPVLMSYFGVSNAGMRLQERRANSRHRVAKCISMVAEKRVAGVLLLIALGVFGGASYLRQGLKIGDLDRGAPELRPDSRYNRDNDFFAAHYSASPDVLVVMVTSKPGECGSYMIGSAVERLTLALADTAGVDSTYSVFDEMKKYIVGSNGGDLKWFALSRNRFVANSTFKALPTELYNSNCSMVPLLVFLSDHKAETLTRVTEVIERFAAQNNNPDNTFLLAAGNAGIEAATNSVIQKAEPMMLLLVYGIVALLVWWEFASWRVALCIMIPLYITSVIGEAIMAQLGLGVKVATMPVIALGVGIGVDYGIYIYNKIDNYLDAGLPFKEAYLQTLQTTGAAVALTAIMLAIGVFTWVFSTIKFQADMGLLLVFMFIWNMVGAIILLPALARFLVPAADGSARRSPVAQASSI